MRRVEAELKGWQAVGVELKLGPRDAIERFEDRLAIEIGLLEGVDPRLDEKDMLMNVSSRCVLCVEVWRPSRKTRLL